MKKRKGLLMFICVLMLGCVFVTGCGKQPVSGEKLIDDLLQSSAYTQYSNDLNISIDNFKVTKRQTATENRIDTAWIEVDSSSDEVTAHMYFVMTYELYNDGWQITNVEEDEIDKWYFTPLKEMTDEEIALYISEDVEIISKDVNLDEGTEYITYTWVEPHKYCDVTYVRQDYFEFGTSNMLYAAGKWNYITTNDAGSTEEWDIVGTWGYEDTNHYVRLTIENFQPDRPLFALYDGASVDAEFNIDGYIVNYYNDYMGNSEKEAQGPFKANYNEFDRYLRGYQTPSDYGYEFSDYKSSADFLITYDKIIYSLNHLNEVKYELNRIE